MSELCGLVAASAGNLFAGAALYVSLAEHPARLTCSTDVAVAQWAPSYRRATVMQVTLALTATSASLVQWFHAGGVLWLWGAATLAAVISFTLVAILPTNARLLAPDRDPRSAETRKLLEKWGRLHLVRTILGMTASILFLAALRGP